MKLTYFAIFSPLEEQTGYCVTVPDLPGCVTQGNSLENAYEMVVDAASGWVLDELEDGNPVPKSSSIDEVEQKIESKNEFCSIIVLDMDSYSEKYGEKSLRKNCTIPAWLNTQAEKAGVNFSEILKDALIKKLQIQ